MLSFFAGGGAERRLRRPLVEDDPLERPEVAFLEPELRLLPPALTLPEVLLDFLLVFLAGRAPEVEDEARLDLARVDFSAFSPAPELLRRVEPPALLRFDFFFGVSQANSSSDSSSSGDRRARAAERLAMVGS